MQGYFAVSTIVLLIITVAARVSLMKRMGIDAMQFGKIDKTDYLIPPFALAYFYMVFAGVFHWPGANTQLFCHAGVIAWAGVTLCLAGLSLMWWSIASFGHSFRVGIDTEHPGKLVTDGAFALTRNPIYMAFALVLGGQFLIHPDWITLAAAAIGTVLFHRQVLREETHLKAHYGEEYAAYCSRVRRYLI